MKIERTTFLKRLLSIGIGTFLFAVMFFLDANALDRGIKIVAKLEEDSGKAVGSFRALVIGIDNYLDSNIPDLKTATNDAREVALVLKRDYGFSKISILLNEKANESNVIKALRALVRESREDDSVFIYYAGHGELDKLTRAGYWVPQNAKAGDSTTYIDNAIIQRYIKAIPARHVLLVSDSCFSGSLFGETRDLPPLIEDNYYATLYKERSRWGLTSGNLTPVTDRGFKRHSIFAYQFLKALKYNEQPYLTPREIYQKIGPIVRNNSEQMPISKPIINTGDEGGEFIFIKTTLGNKKTSKSAIGLIARPNKLKKIENPIELNPTGKNELDEILKKAKEKEEEKEDVDEEAAEEIIEEMYVKLEEIDGLEENVFGAEEKAKAYKAFLKKFPSPYDGKRRIELRQKFWEGLAKLPLEKRRQKIRLLRDMVLISGECFIRRERSNSICPKDFYMDKFEVTQKQFIKIMGKNPSRLKGDNLPVENVTWFEADDYCKKLGKRLPTETEWEFSAKGAGYIGEFFWSNSDNKTHKVGIRESNGYDVFDMLDNVSEWTSDFFDKTLKNTAKDQLRRASRSIRGGSWRMSGPSTIKKRIKGEPYHRSAVNGFRCVVSD